MDGPLPGVERIAVLNASAMGDFVQLLPALDALRSAYPSAVITLLAREWHARLLAGRPGPFDEVVALPQGVIGDEPGGLRADVREACVDELRARRFDLALQMHGGGRNSNPFVLALRARLTAGAATPDAPALDRTIHYELYQSNALRNREIAALVGATKGPLEPRLAVVPADVEASLQALEDDGRPLVVIHPGATDRRRHWPIERFAAVADALAAEGATVGVTGSAGEADIVAGVCATSQVRPVGLADRLSLPALTGLLSRSTLVVANDTGPRHLAAAVGTATLAVYWVGNLLTAGPLTRDRHRVAVSWRTDCPVCGRDCVIGSCEHDASFVADVPLEQVREEAVALFRAELGLRLSGGVERAPDVGYEIAGVLDTHR